MEAMRSSDRAGSMTKAFRSASHVLARQRASVSLLGARCWTEEEERVKGRMSRGPMRGEGGEKEEGCGQSCCPSGELSLMQSTVFSTQLVMAKECEDD